MNAYSNRTISFFMSACFLTGIAHASPAQTQGHAKPSASPNGASSAVAFQAAFAGDLAKLKRLFPSGTGINIQNKDGKTLLHYAVLGGRTDVVRWLVARKIALNAKDASGTTALAAARQNTDDATLEQHRAEIIAFLQEQGAQEAGNASQSDSRLTQSPMVQQTASGQQTLSAKGVTLSELRLPASFAPRKGARSRFYPAGFSADGKTLYARSKWISGSADKPDVFAESFYACSTDKGIHTISESSAEWKAFKKAQKNQRDQGGKWEMGHKTEPEASNPGKKINVFYVTGMTSNESVVCGNCTLMPTGFQPPQGSLEEMARATANATVALSFLWRQDIGFVDFQAFVKSVPANGGKYWNGKLGIGPISNDGTTIACISENTGKAGDEYSGGAHILLVHSATGFGKQRVQALADANPSVTADQTAIASNANTPPPAPHNLAKQASNNPDNNKSLVLSILGQSQSAIEKTLGDPVRKTNQTTKQKAANIYYRAIFSLPGYKEAWVFFGGEPDWTMYRVDLTPLDEEPTWEAALKQAGLNTKGVRLDQGYILQNVVGLPKDFRALWDGYKLTLTSKKE